MYHSDYRFQYSLRNVISSRQTELALSTGQLFTADEALKIGLIDEIATDKADAIAKAEKFLLRMSQISSKYNFELLLFTICFN